MKRGSYNKAQKDLNWIKRYNTNISLCSPVRSLSPTVLSLGTARSSQLPVQRSILSIHSVTQPLSCHGNEHNACAQTSVLSGRNVCNNMDK